MNAMPPVHISWSGPEARMPVLAHRLRASMSPAADIVGSPSAPPFARAGGGDTLHLHSVLVNTAASRPRNSGSESDVWRAARRGVPSAAAVVGALASVGRARSSRDAPARPSRPR